MEGAMKMLVFLWVLFLFPTGYSEENLSFSGDIFHYGQVLDQSEEGFGESDYEIIEYIFNDTALPEDSNLSLARRKDRDPGTLIKGWGKRRPSVRTEKREKEPKVADSTGEESMKRSVSKDSGRFPKSVSIPTSA